MQIEGATRLAERTLGMPVKLGYPRGVGGLTDLIASPAFATAVGLVRQAGLDTRLVPGPQSFWTGIRDHLQEILKEYM